MLAGALAQNLFNAHMVCWPMDCDGLVCVNRNTVVCVLSSKVIHYEAMHQLAAHCLSQPLMKPP